MDLYRAGSSICYADTPTAINREHAIFDANRCVAVNPSDPPGARGARCADGDSRLEAASVSCRPKSILSALDRYHAHDRASTRRTVDEHPRPRHLGGIDVSTSKRSRSSGVRDFPLVNVASALKLSGGRIDAGAWSSTPSLRTRCG